LNDINNNNTNLKISQLQIKTCSTTLASTSSSLSSSSSSSSSSINNGNEYNVKINGNYCNAVDPSGNKNKYVEYWGDFKSLNFLF
jgi:hypothetical protein